VPRGLSPGPDGEPRCWWACSAPDYLSYHDDEWGRPVVDDRGFRLVGPTTAYALMQACGLVDDHISGCAVREAVEEEREAALQTMA
jgi:3-methyladenine DNA glycosylase Tag